MTGSPAARAQRPRRGRVLLVGEIAASPRIAAHFAQRPLRVANMFEAIGEVTAAATADAVAVVIVAEELLRGPHEHSAAALRKIDPSVRIVGVAHAQSPAFAPAGSLNGRAIDAWIAMPLRSDELRRAVDDDSLLADEPDESVFELPEEPAAPMVSSAGSPEPPAAAVPASPDAPLTAAVAPPASPERTPATLPPAATPPPAAEAAPPTSSTSFAPAPAAAAPARQPAAATTLDAAAPIPSAAIGDTDLINAMLHDPAGALPTALRLIAWHTGWTDVRVIDDADADAPHATGAPAAPIVHGSQRFGRLTASGAAPARLRLWADWLAHWLAAEREFRRHRENSLTDELTGARNRRYFEQFLAQAIARARLERRTLTLMVFDIDNFKTYNDQFGHEAGDEILCEIVQLLKSVIRQGDEVCRIGGDEFVVVFADPEAPRSPGSRHPENVEAIARRFQAQVCSMRYPKLGVQAPGTLSISAGLATYPWDGAEALTLLRHADQLALESKRRGKNAITLGRGAAEPCRGDEGA